MGTEDTLKSTGALKCQCRKFSLSAAAAAINEGTVKKKQATGYHSEYHILIGGLLNSNKWIKVTQGIFMMKTGPFKKSCRDYKNNDCSLHLLRSKAFIC